MDKPDKPDKTKKPPRSEQIRRELKKSTDFKHQHVDEGLVERKAELRRILESGTEDDFRDALQRGGIRVDSPEGKRFIEAFRQIHGRERG
jgi:hypothetical protein